MIYWFTGQPCAGKSILAEKLGSIFKKYQDPKYNKEIKRIDGDDLRALFSNNDYSTKGRVYNVDIAQKIAHYSHNQGDIVIVSLVSPYLDQREEFKSLLGDNLIEIYVHTSEIRERDHFKVKGYQPPNDNFIDVDTTIDSIEESLIKLIKKINNHEKDTTNNIFNR